MVKRVAAAKQHDGLVRVKQVLEADGTVVVRRARGATVRSGGEAGGGRAPGRDRARATRSASRSGAGAVLGIDAARAVTVRALRRSRRLCSAGSRRGSRRGRARSRRSGRPAAPRCRQRRGTLRTHTGQTDAHTAGWRTRSPPAAPSGTACSGATGQRGCGRCRRQRASARARSGARTTTARVSVCPVGQQASAAQRLVLALVRARRSAGTCSATAAVCRPPRPRPAPRLARSRDSTRRTVAARGR